MTPTVMPTYSRAALTFTKGEGSWLIEREGRRYLDLTGGIAVNVLGHAHPELVAALTEQAGNLWHTSNLYHIENQTRLADQLTDATFADTVFFTNSGLEAMECCVKMARKYHFEKGAPNRTKIIAFNGSFHGRSLGMISAAGSEKLTKGFGPLLPDFIHLDIADQDAFEAAMGPDIAAVMIEPVVGEGGIIPIPDQCLQGIRKACDEHGALLILDEIQCGMGRTGKLFAHEYSGIKPDIMGIAKGIGGGFPLGACLATQEAASGMVAGSHGSTYGGNPLACAVGSKVMDLVADDTFLADVSRKSGAFRQMLEGLVADNPDIFEAVRGTGLMIGIKCKVTNMDVVNEGYNHEVLTVPGGDNVIRVLPALNISEEELREGVKRLDAVAKSLKAKS